MLSMGFISPVQWSSRIGINVEFAAIDKAHVIERKFIRLRNRSATIELSF